MLAGTVIVGAVAGAVVRRTGASITTGSSVIVVPGVADCAKLLWYAVESSKIVVADHKYQQRLLTNLTFVPFFNSPPISVLPRFSLLL
jgi:hypothetical protein